MILQELQELATFCVLKRRKGFTREKDLLARAAVPNLFLLAYPQAEKIKLAYPQVICEKAFLPFS